jgi:hypothetical protein
MERIPTTKQVKMMQTSCLHSQATPNKDDTSPRKPKIRFEKCDTMEICPKIPTLLELN